MTTDNTTSEVVPNTSDDPLVVEVWKPWPKNPDYEVSSFGNVRNKWGKQKAPFIIHTGLNSTYLMISAREPGKNFRPYPLHTMVLETFNGPKTTTQRPKHRDGDQTNCRLDNLYWSKQGVGDNGADADAQGRKPTWSIFRVLYETDESPRQEFPVMSGIHNDALAKFVLKALNSAPPDTLQLILPDINHDIPGIFVIRQQ